MSERDELIDRLRFLMHELARERQACMDRIADLKDRERDLRVEQTEVVCHMNQLMTQRIRERENEVKPSQSDDRDGLQGRIGTGVL